VLKSLVSVFLLLVALSGCDPNNIPRDVPSCVKDLIRNKTTQPLQVWRYQFQNQTVYLTVPDCCDQYTSVYTAECTFFCAPIGGITGKGDGKCPTFNDEATDGIIIWKAD
jgi:hypothetical protein